jgi:hypothetical protein
LEIYRKRAQRRRKHTELGEELQLALDGSPWHISSPAAPLMDSPLASSGDWLQNLAAGCNSEEVHQWTLEKELPLDMADTMMTKQPSLTSLDWDTELNTHNHGVSQV